MSLYKIHGDEIGIIVNGAFVRPNEITNAQIETFASTFASEFAGDCLLLLLAIREEAVAVACDFNKVRALAHRSKSFAAQLGQWNDRLGALTSPTLRKLEHSFAETADSILKVTNSSAEECEASDWWKHLRAAPDWTEEN